MNGGMLEIAVLLPSGDLGLQRGHVRQSLAQTVANEDRQFNFDHVEPRTVFWGEMELQFVQNT